MNKQIAILVPIYPPHYHYAQELIDSWYKYKFDLQSDLCFVFTNHNDEILFKKEISDSFLTVVLPDNLSSVPDRTQINTKKFYGLLQLKDRYNWIIILDSESEFIKEYDLLSVCNNFDKNKILYGNIPYRNCDTTKIEAAKYFKSHKNFHKLKTDLYLWFNQLCIYKSEYLDDFFDKTDIRNNIEKVHPLAFDYYIYMYYLILYHGYKINDMDVIARVSMLEGANFTPKSDKYKLPPVEGGGIILPLLPRCLQQNTKHGGFYVYTKR